MLPEKMSCGGQFRARVYEDRRVLNIIEGERWASLKEEAYLEPR